MRRTHRLLVTGFGPFPGVARNPTGELVRWLDTAGVSPRKGFAVVAAELPVEWQAGRAALAWLLERHDPDALLQFGASRRAAGFHIEQVARNRMSFLPDAAGRRSPGREVTPGGPRTMRAHLPAARLALRLRSLGLPARASSDAGSYLCNTVFYDGLEAARTTGRPLLCQFVHVPADLAPEGGQEERLTLEGLRKGTLALIDELAAAARRAPCRDIGAALHVEGLRR